MPEGPSHNALRHRRRCSQACWCPCRHPRPPSGTVWQAAAAPSSQMFMLVGVAILLPLVIGYTVFVYWTFRGKVRAGEGYH